MPTVGRRLLVAEGDPDIRLLLEAGLGRAGFELTFAENGLEALERARHDPFDLVILDIAMPRLDGLSVLDQLRADSRTSATPVLLLSASVHQPQIEDGLRRGANAYLKKPFLLNELIATIEQLVSPSQGVEGRPLG